MGKRKPVPARLHSELTEYSSLIRALRTSNSLDVTSHITKPRPYGVESSFSVQRTADELTSDDLSDKSEDQDDHASPSPSDDGRYKDPNVNLSGGASQSRDISPVSGPSSSVEPPSTIVGRKRKRNSTTPSRRRDTWTRWPLLASDVYIPEWSLEDEIRILAADALKLQPRPPLPDLPSQSCTTGSDNGDAEDDDDDTPYIPHLTNAASTYLSTILALLVAHTPNRPQSQQNRIEPIGWRAVLEILGSCGNPDVANQKCVSLSRTFPFILFGNVTKSLVCRIINIVKTRMEAVYGHTTDESSGNILGVCLLPIFGYLNLDPGTAAHRIQLSVAAKEKMRARLSRPMKDLFSFAVPPAPHT
jgi:hypothetical protein